MLAIIRSPKPEWVSSAPRPGTLSLQPSFGTIRVLPPGVTPGDLHSLPSPGRLFIDRMSSTLNNLTSQIGFF
jgi:hypothetical protein